MTKCGDNINLDEICANVFYILTNKRKYANQFASNLIIRYIGFDDMKGTGKKSNFKALSRDTIINMEAH